jgi:hypothetical protein
MLINGYKTQIDEIFTRESIYKSLIVCHDNFDLMSLFHHMKYDHYPVADILNLNKFRENKSRILFIDYIDYKSISKVLCETDIEMINAIFLIGCKKTEHDYFKDDTIKYYIL